MLILLPWRRNGSRAIGWKKYPGFIFWGCEQATVTLLDITTAWRAAGFTAVLIVGKGRIGRGDKMVVGSEASTTFGISSTNYPKFALQWPRSVRNSLFPARGCSHRETHTIHKQYSSEHLLLIGFFLLSTADHLPLWSPASDHPVLKAWIPRRSWAENLKNANHLLIQHNFLT